MINLYDNLNSQTLQLYKTFINANIKSTTVVVNDNGFLPSDVLSPYKFFLETQSKMKDLFTSTMFQSRNIGKLKVPINQL